MFDFVYDGFPAVRLEKASHLVAIQKFLKDNRVSYRTKIVTKRKKSPEFIVMLVGVA
jgi:hypothetical protein